MLDQIEERPLTHRQKDYTGQQYNSWTIVRYFGVKKAGRSHTHYWVCQCVCGAEHIRQVQSVVSGRSKRCTACCTEGGGTRTDPLYFTWVKMRSRCRNPNDADWPYYGALGIRVCARWDSFQAFAADMGAKPQPWMSLDRIDVNGPYCMNNCRWASPKQQGANRRYAHHNYTPEQVARLWTRGRMRARLLCKPHPVTLRLTSIPTPRNYALPPPPPTTTTLRLAPIHLDCFEDDATVYAGTAQC